MGKVDYHESPCDLPPGHAPEFFSLNIECSNDSFLPYWHIETARILKELSESLMEGKSIPRILRDQNGNTIGPITIK